MQVHGWGYSETFPFHTTLTPLNMLFSQSTNFQPHILPECATLMETVCWLLG